VIGSNISNILLVLGISAIVAPLTVSRQLVRGSVPFMILTSIGALALCWDGTLDQSEGLFLFFVAMIYTGFAIYQSRRETAAAMLNSEENEETPTVTRSQKWKRFGIQIGLMIAGLAMLLIGANWLVEGAVSVAKYLGVSEMIIGLTVVAVGTSLPEVATSIVAAMRGQRDIAVGNVVGSNIFNILLVLGIAGASAPSPIVVSDAARFFDMPFMIAVSAACLPIFFTQFEISRGEGALFLSYYIGYTTYLFLQATEHDALQPFSTIMFTFVVPLTAVTLVFATLRAMRNNLRTIRD